MSIPARALPVMPTDPLHMTDVLIKDIYRQLAHDYPERVFAKILHENGDSSTIENVTWGRLMTDVYQAIHSMVQLGMDTPAPSVVGILGTSGYWYYVNLVACWMQDWPVMLLSTRNSLAAQESLLTTVRASILLVDHTYSGLGEALKTQMSNLRVFPMSVEKNGHDTMAQPSLETLGKSRSSIDLDTIIIYAHTSGSQGHPKPVPMTHRQFFKQMRLRSASQYAGTTAYTPIPLFHGMGIYVFTRWPISSGVVPVFVRMDKPVNGHTMLQHLKYLPGSITLLPPSLLEEVADHTLSNLSSLRGTLRVFFGGAPINPLAAERLIKAGVPVVGAFGSTEIGILTYLDFGSSDRLADWPYMRFRDDYYVLNFLPVDESPLREVVFSPNGLDVPSVFNRQNPPGFASNDLWSPHPTIPGLWKHMGRKDDVTVLSNGEKTDNKQLERLLLEDNRIDKVVVFGAGRPLNGIIVQPNDAVPTKQREAFLELVWPRIEKTNSVIPQHSRLIRQMVLIADGKKPFASTDKGTVRTKDTLSLYAAEIDAAYLAMEHSANEMRDDPSGQLDIQQFVKDMVQRVTSKQVVSDDVDLFDIGIDSLHTLQIRLEILPVLKGLDPASVPRNLAYQYPTISQLVEYVANCRGGKSTDTPDIVDKVTRMENCLGRFTDVPFNSVTDHNSSETALVTGYSIILTGATGSLGCHILRELLLNTDVKKVLCLHRGPPETVLQRHIQVFRERSLPAELLQENNYKLEFISCDLSLPSLGLKSDELDFIRSQVTHIIHTAWELNFNWKLEHFERFHIAGVRHLLDLAISSRMPQSPRFIFLSSIGAVTNAPSPVLEVSFDDPSVAGDQGYGEAKFIAERIIDKACKSGLRATILRGGQLSGSTTNGYWASSEYIPSLFRASKELGCLPAKLPDTRWIPVDIAAKCVVALSVKGDDSRLAYYHVENATSTPWDAILQMYIEIAGAHFKVVQSNSWLNLIEQEGHESRDVSALALIPFYYEYAAAGQDDSWVQLDVTRSLHQCSELDFGPISIDIMRKYLQSALEGGNGTSLD